MASWLRLATGWHGHLHFITNQVIILPPASSVRLEWSERASGVDALQQNVRQLRNDDDNVDVDDCERPTNRLSVRLGKISGTTAAAGEEEDEEEASVAIKLVKLVALDTASLG